MIPKQNANVKIGLPDFIKKNLTSMMPYKILKRMIQDNQVGQNLSQSEREITMTLKKCLEQYPHKLSQLYRVGFPPLSNRSQFGNKHSDRTCCHLLN